LRTTFSDPGVLLKQATTLKRQGDVDAAIQTLRQAYGLIAQGSIGYGVDTFLRLPLYLGEAGRNDEAWGEFNRLLVEGYPNQLRDYGVLSMEHSKIYDKMRLFLQREGKNTKAIVFGCLSMLAWAKGLKLQKRKRELAQFVSRENIEATLEPLLKKARLTSYSKEFADLMIDEVRKPSRIDLASAATRTGELTARLS
jgi:hypothetical protein